MNKNNITDKVLDVYKKVNPSTYFIESINEEYWIRKKFMINLFQRRLKFPPKMFENSELIEFGCGTGEHSSFLLSFGAKGIFIDMNIEALKRAEHLFKHFGYSEDRYKLVESRIQDFDGEQKADIVMCMAVLHHLDSKESALKKISGYVKDNGYLILGVGNNAGLFQTNIQRLVINKLSNGNEEKAYQLADELFDEHISRSQKFGRRSRKAIIYDTYINPKIDGFGVSEILEIFASSGLELYSSWPPIQPAIFGDPPNREPINLHEFSSVMALSEIIFSSHREDDYFLLEHAEKKSKNFLTRFHDLIQSIPEVTPENNIDIGKVMENIQSVKVACIDKINIYDPYFERLESLLTEAHSVLDALAIHDFELIKSRIQASKYLFRGTSGIGINWFIGHKYSTES